MFNNEKQTIWKQKGGSFVAPTGATKVKIFLKNASPLASVAYFDEIWLGESSDRVLVEQTLDYYPYGSAMRQYTSSVSTENVSKFNYQGKVEAKPKSGHRRKRDLESGYDYVEARLFDSQIGRFLQVDPLTEEQEQYNPYHYGYNDPIKNCDPDGKFPLDTIWDAMNVLYDVGKIAYGASTNNTEMVKSGATDLVADGAAMVIPYVPAGASKLVKGAEAAVDVAKTAEKITKTEKPANKNSNNAEGNFVNYEIKDKDGKVIKVGKADADRTNAQGDPKRMKDSERKAQKDYPGATSNVVPNSNQKTTGASKEAEAKMVKEHRKNGNPLPLNKEKDKRYQNN